MKIRSTVLFMILALLMVACRQQEPTPTIAPTAETEAIAPTEEPPLTTDAPTEAAQGATVDAPAIQNIVWQWERRVAPTTGAEESISNPGNYTLLFRPNGTVEYRADCNVGIGTYTADAAGAIQIQGGAVTAAACPEGSRDQDMLAMMSTVQSYRLEENGNVLVMVTADNGPQDFYRNQATAGPGIEGEGGEETTATIGLSPEQITLDTQGLPYPWQANVVAATPYDNSQAPGPMGDRPSRPDA
jgi:heat shock protein HslJ